MRKSIKGFFKPSQKGSGNQSPSGSGGVPDSERQQESQFPGDEIGIGPRILTPEPPPKDGPDIVFVHGLRGSRLGTWTASNPEKTCWPRLLSEDIPNARIIAWGYDSSIANVFKPASQESLFNHGETLVSDLAQLRGDSNTLERPIVFICHSLGGLVVKAGLIKSNAYHLNQRHQTLGAIWEATAGVVFMGTPHRGSNTLSYADIACKAAKVTFRQPNEQLLNVLRPDSQLLDNLRDDFTTVSKLMRIVCLWETLAMPIGLIVPESSACYEGFDVRKGPIHANHREMARFSSRNEMYNRTLGHVRYVCGAQSPTRAKESDRMKTNILKALRYKSMNAWQDRIIEAQKYTCDWLVDLKEPPDSFWNWLSKPVETIFWVSGKAGSGKSTLMRYIHEHSDVDENLKRWAGADQVTKAAFFFSEQAEKLLSSREGMLRSVLYQVLSSQTNLISHAYPEYFQRDLIFDADDFTTWTSLSRAFQALLKSAPNFHLFLLIDGLDEFRMYEEYDNYREEQRDLLYDGENEDEGWGINDWIIESHNQLAKFIIDCGAYTNIKICVACRELSSFEDKFSKPPRVRVQQHTHDAIQQYCTRRLEEEANALTNRHSLVSSITSQAHGVFLWVQLVVTSLIRGFLGGETPDELWKRLRVLPPRIGGENGLYMHMLREIDPARLIEAFQLFDLAVTGNYSVNELAVIFFAQESLSKSLRQKIETVETQPWGTILDDSLQPQLELYHRRLSRTTKGLLEVHRDQYCLVQFIHLTAKQFVNRQTTRHLFHIPPRPFDDGLILAVARFTGLLRRYKSDPDFIWYRERELNNMYRLMCCAGYIHHENRDEAIPLLNVFRAVFDDRAMKEPTIYSRIQQASCDPEGFFQVPVKSAYQLVTNFHDLAVLAGWPHCVIPLLAEETQISHARLQTLLNLITYRFRPGFYFIRPYDNLDRYLQELGDVLQIMIARGGDLKGQVDKLPIYTPWTNCVERICNGIPRHSAEAPATLELFIKHGAQETRMQVGVTNKSVRAWLLESMDRDKRLGAVIREATIHTRLQAFINVSQGQLSR